MRDKVIIEEIGDEKVAVYLYDTLGREMLSNPITICHKALVIDEYDIIGEISDGETTMFNDTYEEEDFSDFEEIFDDDY